MFKSLPIAALLALCLLAGCNSTAPQPSTAAVQHIVVIWLREPGNMAHRQTLLEASKQLTQIPGVMAVQGGTVISSDRPVVDSSFDLALVFQLQDQRTLYEYVKHPLHKKLLEEVFKPLIERYRVYDVEAHLFNQ